MTEPRHDLPTDPPLSRLYHEHTASEPSAAMDLRILAAARQELSNSRPQGARRAGWWQRWRMPLSVATTVMLTAMLALLVERQPAEPSYVPSSEQKAVEKIQKRAEPAPDAPQSSQRKAPGGPGEIAPSRAANGAADQAVAGPSPAVKAERAAPAAAPPAPAVSGEMRVAPALSALPLAAAPSKESRAENSRSPAAWLEVIRALRSAGKTEEAERELREFRRAYPDFPLPEEFCP